MKRYSILLAFFTAVTLTGCGDFLEEVSQSEMKPKTVEDFSELLLGSGYPDQNGPSLAFLCLLDDDQEQLIIYTGGDRNQYVGTSDAVTYMPYYTWQPYLSDNDGYMTPINTSPLSTTYYSFYEKIKGCNAVLDFIDEAQGSQSDKDRVKAEALAVRSLLYFELVNVYGQPYNYVKRQGIKNAPGVPLKLNSSLSEDPIARATVDSVYEAVILPDLQEAARLMDPLPVMRRNYRINQPAIHILLSRVYLYMERYEECIQEVDKAIAQGAVMLDMVNNLSAIESENGYSPISYNNPEVEWMFGPFCCFDNVCYGPAHNTTWRAMFNPRNDTRYKAFCLAYQGTLNYCFISKPRGVDIGQSIRTAEAYLNRMEARALLGHDAEALSELNDFRRKRITSYKDAAYSGQDLLAQIRTERRKELCYEGHRWFDLRRYGMPSIVHRYKYEKSGQVYQITLEEADPMYTLPLPSCLLEKNKSLQLNAEHLAIQGTERTGVPEIEEE